MPITVGPGCFFLNLPIVIFSALIVWLFLKDKKEQTIPCPLDFVGLALLFIGIGALQSAFNRWNIDDWFRSPFIIMLFIVSGLCLVFFLIWERFHPTPFIGLSLFKNRNFTLPSLMTGIGIGLLFSSFVLDSLWVQRVLGYTPAWAGLTLSPVGIFPLIFYPLMGRFVSLLDLRIWIILSFILYACTFFWLSTITVYSPFWLLALPRLVQGIGFAFFTVPNALLVVRTAKPDRLTSTVSIFSFVRLFFVSIAVALALTLWIVRTEHYLDRLTERTYESNPLFTKLLTPLAPFADSKSQTLALAYEAVKAEASTLALADIYYLYFWIFLGLCFVVCFYKRA